MTEFDEIYRHYQPKMGRYLARLLGEHEAQDVLQNVMLQVSQSLPEFRGEAALSTWIYRIATNAATDHLRRQRQSASFAALPLAPQPHEGVGPDLGLQHIRDEMGDCVRALVNQLPQGYRLVLLLSDYEELSNPEIANILGVTLETVKIRLHRARERMRKLMECECHFYHHSEIGLMCDRQEKK